MNPDLMFRLEDVKGEHRQATFGHANGPRIVELMVEAMARGDRNYEGGYHMNVQSRLELVYEDFEDLALLEKKEEKVEDYFLTKQREVYLYLDGASVKAIKSGEGQSLTVFRVRLSGIKAGMHQLSARAVPMSVQWGRVCYKSRARGWTGSQGSLS